MDSHSAIPADAAQGRYETAPRPAVVRDPDILARIHANFPDVDAEGISALENLAHLVRTYNVLTERLAASLSTHGLTLARLNVLSLLRAAPEHSLTMSAVGGGMSVTCANVTKLVDGLAADGLVERGTLPSDRRVVLARLTPRGLDLLNTVLPGHLSRIRSYWSGISSAESAALTEILTRIRGNARSGVLQD